VGGAAYVDYPIQHAGVCVVSGAVGVSSSLSIKIDIILYLIVRKKIFPSIQTSKSHMRIILTIAGNKIRRMNDCFHGYSLIP
jgi:hypothetical protein